MADTRLEPLVLSETERRTLENWAKRRKTAQGLALRARVVLACAEGRSNVAVAAPLGVSRTTVRKWRSRFLGRRLDRLGDEPRPGVPRTIIDRICRYCTRLSGPGHKCLAGAQPAAAAGGSI
jgi:hypothetical protein